MADFVNDKMSSSAPPKDDKKGEEDKDKKKGEDAKGPVGVHSKSPAKNCHFIKEKQSYKRSGFYWLKPECAK